MKTPRFWQEKRHISDAADAAGVGLRRGDAAAAETGQTPQVQGEGHLYRQHHRRRCRQDAGGDGHGGTVYQSRQESFFRYPRL